MGKSLTKLSDMATSIAKVAPIILGGLGGLVVPSANGGQSPAKAAMNGDGELAFDCALANYTFYSFQDDGKFDLKQGRGVKLFAAGLIASKVIGAIAEA